MMNEEINRLLELLDRTHSEIRSTIEGVDLETPVHKDAGWKVRDIIGHIAVEDREAVKSIRAYNEGREYSITDFDEQAFNTQAALEMGELSAQRVFEEWERAREDFKSAVQEVPPDRYPGDLLYPWGDERGSIAQLVEDMCEHDEEHRSEIQAAIQGAQLV